MGREQTLARAEGQRIELAQDGREMGRGALGQLLQRLLVVGVQGQRERRVEQPLAAALHVVPQPAHIFERNLRLGRHRLATTQRERAGGLEPDLLPLQLPRRLVGRDRSQVQRADEAFAEPNVALVDRDLDRFARVALGRRADQGGGDHELLKRVAIERMDAEPGSVRAGRATLVHKGTGPFRAEFVGH